MHGEGIGWGNAGSAYYAVHGDRIVALLYFEEATMGEEGGPGGDMVMAPPGWFVVFVDDPDNHEEVDAPALTAEMQGNEVAATTGMAFDVATGIVLDRIGGGR